MNYYKDNTNSIGGYFELETNLISEYHSNGIAINTARNALEYILRAKKVQKIYLPYYTCDVLLEPLKKLQLQYEFYTIDVNFEPVFDYSKLCDHEYFLYTNYFGLKDDYIDTLMKKCKNLIIDNAQAFFSKPIEGISTLYSARKFFGVSDGAYLYCNDRLNAVFDTDCSVERMSHLLIRKDISAEVGYSDFINNDQLLENQPIKLMSKLTKSILQSIDYDRIARVRIDNFNILHKSLGSKNKLKLSLFKNSVPMVYPFWSEDLGLRKKLLVNKVYTATYWPNVKEWCGINSLEYSLTNEVIHLPIDQRYSKKEMELIINTILNV
ncbi:hypothetical protein ACSVH2_09745 [Flavobacterium sp. RSB2_4_14]|uniref:hypothetical protein n=1 Tax=Flavobacterium sp. RSB2_4_14 TaxID=3447665 RepID=UPI003F3390A2